MHGAMEPPGQAGTGSARAKRPTDKRAVTIYQVAERAGVSPSTVSRVLNGKPVDPTMAERVRQVAEELNFVPSQTAINLSRSRTHTVGMVLPDLANPTFQAALRGLDAAAAANGFRVMVADSHESLEEEVILAQEVRRRCDALVLCAPRMEADKLREILPDLAPVVVINRFNSWVPAPVVAADYRAGIHGLVDHLVGLGHTRLTYLAGNPNSGSHRERLAGIDDALAAAPGLSIETVKCGVGFADGFGVAELVAFSASTGVLAFNDLVGMGLLSGLNARGVRVPEDVSVVGFDDIPFSAYTTPPLTTSSVAATDLGAMAWERVWDLLNERTPGSDQRLAPRLLVRGSTGAPRTR
jgi:LacI family transcriptional regulator